MKTSFKELSEKLQSISEGVLMVRTQKTPKGDFKWLLQKVEHNKTETVLSGTESSRAKADAAGKKAKKKAGSSQKMPPGKKRATKSYYSHLSKSEEIEEGTSARQRGEVQTPKSQKEYDRLSPKDKKIVDARIKKARAAGTRRSNPTSDKEKKQIQNRERLRSLARHGRGFAEEVIDEAKTMGGILRKVKKGTPPYTVVAMVKGKVVGQQVAKVAAQVPAIITEFQGGGSGATDLGSKHGGEVKIAVEDKDSRVVYSEQYARSAFHYEMNGIDEGGMGRKTKKKKFDNPLQLDPSRSGTGKNPIFGKHDMVSFPDPKTGKSIDGKVDSYDKASKTYSIVVGTRLSRFSKIKTFKGVSARSVIGEAATKRPMSPAQKKRNEKHQQFLKIAGMKKSKAPKKAAAKKRAKSAWSGTRYDEDIEREIEKMMDEGIGSAVAKGVRAAAAALRPGRKMSGFAVDWEDSPFDDKPSIRKRAGRAYRGGKSAYHKERGADLSRKAKKKRGSKTASRRYEDIEREIEEMGELYAPGNTSRNRNPDFDERQAMYNSNYKRIHKKNPSRDEMRSAGVGKGGDNPKGVKAWKAAMSSLKKGAGEKYNEEIEEGGMGRGNSEKLAHAAMVKRLIAARGTKPKKSIFKHPRTTVNKPSGSRHPRTTVNKWNEETYKDIEKEIEEMWRTPRDKYAKGAGGRGLAAKAEREKEKALQKKARAISARQRKRESEKK